MLHLARQLRLRSSRWNPEDSEDHRPTNSTTFLLIFVRIPRDGQQRTILNQAFLSLRLDYATAVLAESSTIMRVVLQLFGLACLALQGTHADVKTVWKDITSDKDIQLEQGGASSLIKPLDDALPNVSVDQVVADANHEMTIKSGKYKWPATKDDNEFDSESWYPQGISSSVDAGDAKYNKNHLFLVSWYAKKDKEKGVRITFVDTNVSPPKYRQVLLVEPTGTSSKPSFKTVGVHAGGIAWYGNLLYVADTDHGVRLFDIDHIYKVKDGDGAGRQSNGDYHAYGYK